MMQRILSDIIYKYTLRVIYISLPKLVCLCFYSFVLETPWGWCLGTEICRAFWNSCTDCSPLRCICWWIWL